MGKISIQDLSSVLVEKRGLSKKDASAFISTMFDIVQQELEKDKIVKIKGLGTFKIIDVDDRESVNVNTGERVLIEGHGKISFVPDSLMKELVNKPFSQFETVVLNDGVEFEDAPKEESEPEPVEPDGDPSKMALVDFGLGPVAADLSSFPVIEDKPRKEAVIQEEAPVISEEEPVISEEEPFIEEKTPVIQEEDVPAVEEDVPAVEKETPAPVVEEKEVLVVEEEVPAEEETPAEEEVPADEEASVEEEPVDEEEPSGSHDWIYALVTCLLGLVVGYLLGNFFPFTGQTQAPQQEQVVAPVAKPEKPAGVKPQPVKPDSIAGQKAETSESEAKAPESAKAPEPSKASEPVAASDNLHDKYAAKDARVRLGGYRIVGTDKVVKAKEGETLGKISRRVFGPDMECYLEVFNDMKASDVLKEGQEIKIPKLEIKKKKKNL